MKLTTTSIAAACVCWAGLATSASVLAETAEPSWLGEDYPYLVVDQSVEDALLEFGHNLDLAIDVTRVAGNKRVQRYDHDGSSGAFLNYLVTEHGLDWVVDGRRVFVSSVDERITRSWSGEAGALNGAKAALAKAGLDDARYQIGIGADQGVLSLTAPPRYMAKAVPVIENTLAPKATQTVNVIHGRTRDGGT